MSKKAPKPKTAPEGLPQEATPASTTEPAVPLDLLCDMAWRIAFARNNRPAERADWWNALHDAHLFIQLADLFRKMKHEDAKPDVYLEHAEKTIFALATEDEYWDQLFAFERGCELITGRKKADAIDLFRRAFERDCLPVGADQLKEFEAEGFPYDELAPLRAAFLRIRKPELRKNRSTKK